MGDSLLMKALAQSTGRSAAKIKEVYQEEGDLGKIVRAGPGLLFALAQHSVEARGTLRPLVECRALSGSRKDTNGGRIAAEPDPPSMRVRSRPRRHTSQTPPTNCHSPCDTCAGRAPSRP